MRIKLINIKFLKEGVGIQHILTLIIISLLLLLYVSGHVVGIKRDLEKVQLLVLPSSPFRGVNKSLHLSIQCSHVR